MSSPHPMFPTTMCCICFEGITSETCVVDTEGIKWDVCKGQCAKEAGVEEKRDDDAQQS